MADQSERRANAVRRQELADATVRAETAQAERLLADFVVQLRRAGATPQPLRATLLGGGRARTKLVGWYLNQAQTLAVAPDGAYYNLVTPGSMLARFTGVTLAPSPPPIVIGRGARDGESGDLSDYLERALASYTGR